MKKRILITLDPEIMPELEKEFNVSALINALLRQRYKINDNSVYTKETKKDKSIYENKDKKDTIKDEIAADLDTAFEK